MDPKSQPEPTTIKAGFIRFGSFLLLISIWSLVLFGPGFLVPDSAPKSVPVTPAQAQAVLSGWGLSIVVTVSSLCLVLCAWAVVWAFKRKVPIPKVD